MTAPLWTVKEALGVFTRQQQPIQEWRLRLMIRAVSLTPRGHARSGPEGGRPRAMYEAGTLQRFHALITDYVSGEE